MPSASLSATNMNTLVRDTYQANGLIRSHQHQHHQQQALASSQTSLQKLPTSSPQFLYASNQQQQQQQGQQQQQQHMQFPPPPPLAPLVPKNDSTTMGNSFNSLIVPQPQQQHQMQQQQQQQQQQSINMAHANMLPQTNGISGNSQPTILMSPMMTNNKNAQLQPQQQQHYLQSPQQYQQQIMSPQLQQQQQLPAIVGQQQLPIGQPLQQQQQQQQQPQQSQAPLLQQQQQQQVPMTTIMIPSQAAAQIQSASIQIQQAAMQAMANNPGQPQILVFMIPYIPYSQQQQQQPQPQLQQPTTIMPPTPEQQVSLNSSLVRHSQSNASIIRASGHHNHHNHNQQQQQQQMAHSRAVSSLSNSKQQQQEPEKFYIKANFSYQATRNKMELSFQKGDILHVLDTLQNSDYGTLQYWLATRVKSNGKDADKGLIPDKNKADELALEQRTSQDIGSESGLNNVNDNNNNNNNNNNNGASNSGSVLSASVGRVSFLKRRAAQRSKSLCKDNWDNVVFDIGSFKLPAYERVVFKHPGFCRPVVIFGPLADVAREKLLKDYPEKYSYPTGFHQSSQNHPKVIRLKGILEVVDQGKHALLDITPAAVEKLNYVHLAPIVIFMKTDSKSIIKEFRSRAAKSLDPNARDEDTLRRDGKSSRKLLEQSVKLEKMWYHVFTATLNLSTMGSEMWYRKLRETIENQQSINVWMGERKSSDKSNKAAASGASVNNVNNNNINSSTTSSNSTNNNPNEMLFQMPNSTQSSSACVLDSSSVLNERFNESLTITSKSTIDLLPDGTYGNRSQLRNAYVHSLAQKLARASSEPKLNGLMSDHDNENEDNEDDDDDDDDEIIKKPFPSEYENTSSISSSNGATSYGQGSMSGSNMTYQHYPPPTQLTKSTDQLLNNNNNSRGQQESIYSRNNNQMVASGSSSNNINNNNSYSNGNSSSNSNYHPLPPMNSASDNNNGYHNNQSMNNINNNVIDLSRNHETRGSAFQVYSDMNQNNYHYYNINKI